MKSAKRTRDCVFVAVHSSRSLCKFFVQSSVHIFFYIKCKKKKIILCYFLSSLTRGGIIYCIFTCSLIFFEQKSIGSLYPNYCAQPCSASELTTVRSLYKEHVKCKEQNICFSVRIQNYLVYIRSYRGGKITLLL